MAGAGITQVMNDVVIGGRGNGCGVHVMLHIGFRDGQIDGENGARLPFALALCIDVDQGVIGSGWINW